jgi:dTDP-4-amino-4,6-dideoxygalactose transaminase
MSAPAGELKVPFSPLLPTDPERRRAIDDAVRRVLDRGRFILGPEVAAFEAEFARYIGVPEAVACASGTDAIALALTGSRAQPGDGVVVPANACVPVAAGVRLAGAVPVLADVDPQTLTLDAASVERSIQRWPARHARFVLAVHLYGGPADLDGLARLCRSAGMTLLEDCAQSHGARWRGRQTGGFGAAAAFSFYPTKNLGALGDGGAVATGDPRIAEAVRRQRQYGWTRRDFSESEGRNSRLDEIQATILRAKLPWLDADNDRRRQIARRYDDAFADLPLTLSTCREPGIPVRHLYPIRTSRREELRAYLSAAGIETAIHYPVPLHLQPAYAFLGYEKGDFPVSEQACSTVLSLPVAPALTDDQVSVVIEAVRSFLA